MHGNSNKVMVDRGLVGLVRQQQLRWSHSDMRLPSFTTAQIHELVKSARELSRNNPIVIGSPDEPYCMAFPGRQLLPSDSEGLVYFEELSGVAQLTAFREIPGEIIHFRELVSALEAAWSAAGIDAALFYWPTRDGDMGDHFISAGYMLDSYMAVHMGPMPDWEIGNALKLREFTVRSARPKDEASILEIHRQVVQAHIPNAPFAREVPTSTFGIRERLRKFWAKEPGSDMVPLILVVEAAGHVVAMADCWIHPVAPRLENPLRPGKYAYINSFGVASGLRRSGIGKILASRLSTELGNYDLDGSYLIYSPYNESARSFWPSIGYEPMWTLYQKRGLSELVSG
jgi:ribosomal protein S18 acetylase RimI-like enzyme